ncbi:hypothetical protein, partial [Intestinimonas sp. HCP28S3_D6]|uniref:hypothetical protein n=1 Tax=Intestinimonas sp. HCP28S3_D6 TaxID=3438942 RepID=UPI003F886395
HEHEALGGGSGRRLYCRLTSFSRSLQIILRINLDGTFKLAHFDGFTMGLRPIFESNGWENGFTEGHFGGEISPTSLTDF